MGILDSILAAARWASPEGKLVSGVDDGVGGVVMVGRTLKLLLGCSGVAAGAVEVVTDA